MNEQATKPTRGRPKGSNSFVKIRLSDLVKSVGDSVIVPVSTVWLREQGLSTEEKLSVVTVPTVAETPQEQPAISFTLTPAESDEETVYDSQNEE